jgi:antitoxin component YwqK of YwqJK toxin-antitoxin module
MNAEKKDGKEIDYYSSGKIKSSKIYKNGRLNGLAISWYENGNIYIKAFYKNNILVGKYEQYYLSGMVIQLLFGLPPRQASKY